MQRKFLFLSTSTKHEAVVHIIFFKDLTQLCMLIFPDTDQTESNIQQNKFNPRLQLIWISAVK